MLGKDEAHSLAKWIQDWKKTYRENPKINECITWFEWKYKDKKLSLSDKNFIATILRYNSEE
tara:strand:+ start:450 stop:635 length:186 start_codon:yes stop_codon:yes gene_type:complete